MKNKIIILSLLTFVLFSSCDNPFVGIVENTETKENIIEQVDNNTENDNPITESNAEVTEGNDETTEPEEPITEPGDEITEPEEPITEPGDEITEPEEPITEPGDETTEPEEPITEPGDETTEQEKPITEYVPPQKSIITFNSSFEIKDVIINSKIEETKIILSVDSILDLYEWHIGDVVFSNSNRCELDFSSYADGVYPVVLYGHKDGIFYSNSVNIIKKDGGILSAWEENYENNSRTVFPNVNKYELSQIKLEILSDKNEVVGRGSWRTFSEFSKTKISLIYGKYNFKITAKHKSLNVIFEKQIEINSEEQIINVDFQFEKMFCNETGNIETLVYFKNDFIFNDAIISIYKKTNTGFDLYNTDSINYGQLTLEKGKNDYSDYQCIRYVLNNIDCGIYWIRIDCILANGTKAGYYVDYIYVASNETSKIETKVDDYFDLFNISYKNNGGFYIGESLQTKVSQFDNFVLPDNTTMYKPGFIFDGWYYDKNFQLPITKTGVGSVNKDLVLYAKWLANDNSVINAGVGLINDSKITIDEKTDGIEMQFIMEDHLDLICVDVYDSEGRILTTDYDYLEKGENGIYSAGVSFRCRKNDVYLIEISSYKTVYGTDSCIYKEKMYTQKQVFKALYNH